MATRVKEMNELIPQVTVLMKKGVTGNGCLVELLLLQEMGDMNRAELFHTVSAQ